MRLRNPFVLSTLFACASVGAFSLLSAACSSSSATPGGDAGPTGDGGGTVPTGEPIVVGVSQAFTGSAASVGPVAKNAVTVAQNQINAVGGVLGRPIEYRIKDDATDTAVIEQVVHDFFETDHVVGIIGPTTSGGAGKVQPYIHEKKVLMIAPSAGAPTLASGEPPLDRYFFRTMASHALQAKAQVIFATSAGHTCTKAAVVHHDDGYGNPFALDLAREVAAHGGAVVKDIKVPGAVKPDYNTEIDEILAVAPAVDCQFLILQVKPGAQYLKDFRAKAPSSTILTIGGNGMKFDSLVVDTRQDPANPASPAAAEGAYVTIVDTNPQTTEYATFKHIYTAQFPLEGTATDLPTQVTNIYDAAILMALAVQAAGATTDPVAIRDKLFAVSRGSVPFGPDRISELFEAAKQGKDVVYKGASGPLRFDDNGDVQGDFVVWKVDTGTFKKETSITAATLAQ